MMLQALFWSLLTGLLWTVVGAVFARAPGDRNKLLSFFALYALVYFAASLALIPLQGPSWREVGLLAGVLLPGAAAELGSFWLLKKAMESGSSSVAWAVMQSAMILPFLGGLLLPGAQCEPLAFCGLAAVLGGLGMLAQEWNAVPSRQGQGARRYRLLLAAAFLLTGLSQFLRLLPNYMHLSEATLAWRVTLGACIALGAWGGAAWSRKACEWKAVWKLSLLYGGVVLAGQYAFFRAIDAAAERGWSAAVCPAAIGSCIILFTLYNALFRRERLSRKGWCGILLIASGIAGLAAG